MKVILFGVGGVGSWCAEALVRGGVDELTIVDFDVISVSNINRQLMATTSTVGLVKVDVLRERLTDINPRAAITAVRKRYDEATAGDFCLDDYDYVIDAIDSVNDKALLIYNACASHARLVSSMGAAGKVDPLLVRVAEFWKVRTCPLARALRQKFKKSGCFPEKKFLAVYSEELTRDRLSLTEGCSQDEGEPVVDADVIRPTRLTLRPHIQVTATFGMNIAAIVLNSPGGD